MKRSVLTHQFVDAMPSELAEGILYVSIRFRTAAHLCACGCGDKIVTPIKPAKWHLIFDGDTVSLCPSVGSWQSKCRSHYWIENDKVKWGKPWTDEQIAAGRRRDQQDLHEYYARRGFFESGGREVTSKDKPGLLSRMWSSIKRRRSS